MCEFREKSLEINCVETRQQRKERESEEESDRVCMEQENASSKTLDLLKGDGNEEVTAREADELILADEQVLADVEEEGDRSSEVGVEVDALEFTCVLIGSDQVKFVEEVGKDPTLKPLRDLADKGE